MKAIGFIPLRKNSKEIPGKNKRKLLGRPLFSWVLIEAVFSNLHEVFVYTDDSDIRSFIEDHYKWTSKIKVFDRSEESASDEASTESAMLEFCNKINFEFDIFCLLQATSPFTGRENINAAIQQIESGKDSCLSVVRTHRFIWDENGTPKNYDFTKRPRRQDFEGSLVENGAIYCTTQDALNKTKNRISGNIGILEMPQESYTELDSKLDWSIIENILLSKLQSGRLPGRIHHLFLDVDGVFTDGRILYSKNGELAKVFDMRDGMGLEILRQDNIEVSVMTSENSPLVKERMKKLKIDNVYSGVKDKYGLLQHLSIYKNLNLDEVAYLGDDVNDMACMGRVGWSMTPHNAMDEIKKISDVVLTSESGSGAIREACRFITKYNKRFE
ncbi:acylneuraminate cytidylyltransferase [Christiangramia echinicola]|uniref:N-acylneuraminate cytidylyltransferase n=1 Tax=Christiangramia echinicola TaxID=279359 RepID=A0A1H1L3A7_9FLAO|nr:acylneuraminate cytidylyltransferase [Christiangramia echinicola]SDR69016.1 N-acylneuraminate cytidylyltransferase [Christiangramia echinicola]